MKTSTLFFSSLIVIGLFLIFISGAFFSAARHKKNSRIGFYRGLINNDWTVSEQRNRKVGLFQFFLGIGLLILGASLGLLLQ